MPPKTSLPSSAPRVAVHRARLTDTGYQRADIAIPQAVSLRVRELARCERTSYAQALASLVQLGLSVYEARGTALPEAALPDAAPVRAPALRPTSSAFLASAGTVAARAALRDAPTAVSAAPGATVPEALAQAALSPIALFFRTHKKE
jgi:hypothetical protein